MVHANNVLAQKQNKKSVTIKEKDNMNDLTLIFIVVLLESMIMGCIIGAIMGKMNQELNHYKKMWNTLKAESGYRETIGCCGISESLKNLMEYIEKRKG